MKIHGHGHGERTKPGTVETFLSQRSSGIVADGADARAVEYGSCSRNIAILSPLICSTGLEERRKMLQHQKGPNRVPQSEGKLPGQRAEIQKTGLGD